MPTLWHKIYYYTSIAVMNAAVGVFFVSVTVKAPIPPAIPIPSAHPMPRPALAKSGTPTRITIPSLDIDVPIAIGTYDAADNSWTLDAHHAFYAAPSLPVNDQYGHTLIYGHRLSNIFARLSNIEPNAEAVVYTDNGYAFHYEYESRIQVEPTDVNVFSLSGPPTLVLQTCSGSWDQFRTLFSLKLVGVTRV